MAATSPAILARRRAAARRRFWTRMAWVGVSLVVLGLGVGLAFAGSPDRLATGTRVAGVDVGGLSPAAAERELAERWQRLATIPIVFRFGSHRFPLSAQELGVQVDWASAVAAARRHGDGFGFVRGYRRLELKLFPANVTPVAHASDAALAYELALIGKATDRAARDAQLVRRGLHFQVVRGESGRLLDRTAAASLILASLSSFDRGPAALPVDVSPPDVTAASLSAAQRSASVAVSAPVTLAIGATRIKLPRWRIATLLDLSHAAGGLRFGGPGAAKELQRLQQAVNRAPRDADWAVGAGGTVRVVPARPGVALDVPRSAAAILAAAERPVNRVATLPHAVAQPARSTAQAQALGITGTVGAYETFFGGVPNRIHNVELVAHLVDRKLIAPGATFSFNKTTGDRSAARGFLQAPVIINGEVQTGLGGGVCQVSTTVFNAAFVAGLPITARTNHALYISHYPLGRDATVDYPDVDLRFVNDTGHWLLLRTWVSSSSLTVALYGTPQHRRVESVTQPLRVVAPPPVQKTNDPSLAVGQTTVTDPGAPAQATRVERKVYSSSGKLLSDQTWSSYYRALPKQVTVGTKKPKVKPATPLSPDGTAPTAPH